VKFEPAPDNPFPAFLETYSTACGAVCPKLRAFAGKWNFEDLIPGLSDFDTRLIFAADTTGADWAAASLSVGRIHTRAVRDHPEWSRILEHLPGVNMTTSEVLDPHCYTPEMRLWTIYRGDLELPPLVWNAEDERFHLKKFAAYFGPYQRGIDPAVNLGRFESKYPLHSRYMHYFAPPVQAAVALYDQRPMRGKLDALRRAREIFPHSEVVDRVLAAIAAHYELPEDYEDRALAAIEHRLQAYLQSVLTVLAPCITLVTLTGNSTVTEVRETAAQAPATVHSSFFELTRFSRLMRGRLLFFAEDIPWFESAWLIRNELSRIGSWFYAQALRHYGSAAFGAVLSPEEVLKRVDPQVIPAALARGFQQFAAAASRPIEEGRERSAARCVADYMEPAQLAIEALTQDLRNRLAAA
jgi:hypothetical protein